MNNNPKNWIYFGIQKLYNEQRSHFDAKQLTLCNTSKIGILGTSKGLVFPKYALLKYLDNYFTHSSSDNAPINDALIYKILVGETDELSADFGNQILEDLYHKGWLHRYNELNSSLRAIIDAKADQLYINGFKRASVFLQTHSHSISQGLTKIKSHLTSLGKRQAVTMPRVPAEEIQDARNERTARLQLERKVQQYGERPENNPDNWLFFGVCEENIRNFRDLTFCSLKNVAIGGKRYAGLFIPTPEKITEPIKLYKYSNVSPSHNAKYALAHKLINDDPVLLQQLQRSGDIVDKTGISQILLDIITTPEAYEYFKKNKTKTPYEFYSKFKRFIDDGEGTLIQADNTHKPPRNAYYFVCNGRRYYWKNRINDRAFLAAEPRVLQLGMTLFNEEGDPVLTFDKFYMYLWNQPCRLISRGRIMGETEPHPWSQANDYDGPTATYNTYDRARVIPKFILVGGKRWNEEGGFAYAVDTPYLY